LQDPKPSQDCPLCVPALHVLVPQAVPAPYTRQAPFPSHEPSRSHEAAPSSGHSASGSVPLATLPQVPLLPEPLRAAEHAVHAPAHAVLQQ
jgi:hypothetical protein